MKANDPTPAPLFDGRNLVRATVTAALSGGALAATLYAPRWPIPCAIIALVIVAFAAQMNIALVNPGVIVPQVRITSTLPIAVAEPPAEAAQEVVTSAPVTTVAVEQPAISRRVVPTRAPSGKFATGGTVAAPVEPRLPAVPPSTRPQDVSAPI